MNSVLNILKIVASYYLINESLDLSNLLYYTHLFDKKKKKKKKKFNKYINLYLICLVEAQN